MRIAVCDDDELILNLVSDEVRRSLPIRQEEWVLTQCSETRTRTTST